MVHVMLKVDVDLYIEGLDIEQDVKDRIKNINGNLIPHFPNKSDELVFTKQLKTILGPYLFRVMECKVVTVISEEVINFKKKI